MTLEEILYAIFGTAGGGGLLAGLAALFRKLYITYKAEKEKGISTPQAINITINSLTAKQTKPKKLKKPLKVK